MEKRMESLLKEVEKEVTEHFGERALQMVKAGFATNDEKARRYADDSYNCFF